MNKLIINADDFGASDKINKAIAFLLKNQYITSTTLMLGMPNSADAIEYVKSNNIKCVGLHLNLSDGYSIINNKRKLDFVVEYNNLNVLYQIKNYKFYLQEINRQLEYITEEINISHLDGHRHTQIYPLLLGPVIIKMKKYNISKIRREYTYLFSQNLFKRIIKRYIFNKIKNTNTNTTDYFFDLNYFIENIDRIKKFKNKTIEIMCHPSINNNDFNTLMSDEFKHIKEYFTLISYKDL